MCFLTFIDDLLYYGIIQPQIILFERGVWGPPPENFY